MYIYYKKFIAWYLQRLINYVHADAIVTKKSMKNINRWS
jgi:hypothetical protein